MFALWYFSLAVDEMRKYFGWKILDKFYSTTKAGLDNKSITNVTTKTSDSKPVHITATPSPAQSTTLIPNKPDPQPGTKTDVTNSKAPFNDNLSGGILNSREKVKEIAPTPSTPTKPLKNNLFENKTATISKAKEPAPVTPTTTSPSAPSLTSEIDNNSTPSKPAATTVTVTLKQRDKKSPKNTLNSNTAETMPITNNVNKIKTSVSSPINPALATLSTETSQGVANKGKTPNVLEDYSTKITTNASVNDIKNATNNFLNKESLAAKQLIPLSKQEDTMVDAAVLTKLEEGFAKLAASDSKSLLKKYLTKEVFDNLKNKKTPTFGSSLLDCIQSGLENHDSGVGIYAPDAEAYTVFAELFDPIIEDYHAGFKKTDKHPPRDFGDVASFANLDPNNEFVISTRVRCGRSLQGYPFNPCLTEAQYKEMEQKVSSTLSGLEGELKGKFYPLTGMEKAVQQQLIDDHFLFKEGDRFLQAANACRYWPSGRGIYHNDNKTFLVWCNEEDHLRIISMQMGGDLGEVYRRLVTAVNEIEKRLPFSHDDRLGFLTFCPTNLGTTIRASVHIKVPKLAANKAKLEEVAAKYNLQVRGTRGEHTEAEGGVYDISNKRRMGLTEYQAVKEMNDGITELIKLEKSM